MTITEFLIYLDSLDIKLLADGERLRCYAPKGMLTPELQAEIAERKIEILIFLRNAGSDSIPSILPVSRAKNLPLSFAQQRLWLLDQLEPNNSSYNIPAIFRLKGSLNVRAVEQSLREIVRRHEALRTTFRIQAEEPVQVISPDPDLSLPLTDLSNIPESERERRAQQLVIEASHWPFDLERGPLFQASLLRLSQDDHILMLNQHHIISDGWSLGILVKELTVLYEAFTSGQPSPLTDLSIQYADFAVWQREWLQGELLEAQLTYWTKQLEGVPAVLDLPTDHPRPAMQTYRGAQQALAFSSDLAASLKALSQQEGATLFMTLLAAFQTLLYRYTGQDDIVVGTPIAGRTQIETEGLIGFFVNTLVMRTDLSRTPTFRELLGRVKEVALGAYSHQDLPFERLVEELQPERALSHNPVFQVMFILQNTPSQALTLPGIGVKAIARDRQAEKFDLTLTLWESEEGLKGRLSYNMDLFDASTIERMAEHYQTLLQGIGRNPEQRLLELPLLTAAKRHQMLVCWNDTQTEYPNDLCLHQLIERQSEQTPDRVAFAFPSTRVKQQNELQLTYRELNQKADRLAQYLRHLGVGPNTAVGLYLERSWEMIVGLLGVLKAGGAYLPLDPAYPPERLAFMLADSQAPALLTHERLVSVLPDHSAQVLCLDRDWADIEAEAAGKQREACQDAKVNPTDLAYVIYTSGSTGKPKGVQIAHQAAVNFLTAMAHEPGLTRDDILLAVTTLSFDIALLELFLPLMVGAQTVVASREVAADGHQLQNYLARYGITVMQATPATWKLLMASGWAGKKDLRALCGGEALSRELANQLLARCEKVWNLYGPTETTVWSTVGQVEEGQGSIGLGHPIANTQLYVLDALLEPVPIGLPGELYIGGEGLATGYLHRPELTADRFIPNPFSDNPTARLYKTGDQVRYRATGQLEFLGRIDHQVKIRGFRIELGEIEALLRQHAVVAEAVVIAREDTPDDKRLVAYLALNQGAGRPSQAELRAYLKEKMPDYMTPATYLFLKQFPLTPNGKINRSALPAPERIAEEVEELSTTPRDILELQLTKIWEQVLKRKSIGTGGNFFALGGHSLLAVQLVSRIGELVGQRLPLATLFQAPTVAQMADILRDKGWTAPWSSLVPIQPAGSKPPFFFIHGHGGNVVGFYDLARRLGDDQPFYGLQAQGLDGKAAAFERLEEMAQHYIKEIQTIQPQGPYFIGGFCFGGKVAFEMAQQLRAIGEVVALLAMFQTYHRSYPRFRPGTTTLQRLLYRLITRIDLELSNFLEVEADRKLLYSTGKLKHLWTRAQVRLGQRFGPRLFKPQKDAQYAQAYNATRLEAAHSRALRSYIEQPYQGPVTLFRTKKQLLGISPDPTLGWGEDVIKNKMDIHEIPGHLVGMLDEPRVQIVAEKLQGCLKDAQDALSSSHRLLKEEV